jgi:uncharacterized repeat protein (TIGR01451 family)
MSDAGADSKLFEELACQLLQGGAAVRFQARGASMSPAIRDGEVIEITPVIVSKLRKDDIVLTKTKDGFRLHRIAVADPIQDRFITRGDCGQQDDSPVSGSQILGVARVKEVRIGRSVVKARFRGVSGRVLRCAARAERIAGRILNLRNSGPRARFLFCILGVISLAAMLARAQVAVDATTSAGNEFTGNGTFTLGFRHTTAGAANTLLLLGVSMNISNAPTSSVIGITYNGTALSFLGAHNDTANTRRVEMWYLLSPAAGRNLPVNVSVNIPVAGATVGVVAGATTFTDVDQSIPLGSFISSDGTGGANSQMDVPGVVNGMILDTLATGGDQGVTVSGPQVEEWNVTTASGTDPPAVSATGSSRTGAPSVPISETFSGTSNWSLGAVSINPSTADIGVTTSVSAVPLGQNSTYNITVTNNGPSAANNVTLTDTFAGTNLSLVSVTPSAGTTCTTTTTINCTLPTPFASGATATVAVVVATTAAGFYPNTAQITDSGTPPDPNTGNNSYVALAPVVSVYCSSTVLGAAGAPLSGVLNTYYPGRAGVAAGATSIPVGTATGAGQAIANGSLLLVIQMQDASISTTNSVAYGNGSTGAGFVTIDNAGNYEYVTATGPVAGGAVPIHGAGANGGLVFGYTNAAASTTKGASRYQVVLVPQYLSATLGAATALAWNGSTGGVLALDIAGQLDLGGATVSVDGLGFRGGAGMQLNGNFGGANTDYQYRAPTNYGGTVENGVDASKGEGVAGTPKFVESGGTYLRTTTAVGYPSGRNGVDGSMARGAPGNAGGGGTDANPAANDQNAGGGGGGNGGSGGFGGDSWNTNLSVGGEGGGEFPATIDRIAMGGGGGAGTRNNSPGDNQASSAAAGGGIIFIRADSLTGTATLTANGASAYNGTANDAGGGGGAGGTIVVLAAHGGESGLTLHANGGNGGNAWPSQTYALTLRHGPGGGGGGGVILVSGAPASVSVSGGANGLTLNSPSVPYGATPGNPGMVATNTSLGQVTGIQSASLCAPDLTLSKSHVGNFVRGSSASYQISVSNVSLYGATVGLVTVNDTLPLGLAPTGASGTGWSCGTSGQTISCTRADSLPPASSYPAITLNASVSQSAPATITNTAIVGGGGEANLLNDIASDTANVISIADLSVTDAGSPNPVAAGSNITYTQVVTNNGPSAADNTTLNAVIPANTTLVSMAAPAGWSCLSPGVGGTGKVVCSNVNMPALTAGSFTLVVKVNSGAVNGTVITGSVSVGSSVSDSNPANNSASVSTVVGATAGGELTVSNGASPNPVQPGANITYTQVVTNTGSSAATGATFTENTPANTSLVSIAPPAGWNCGTFPPQCTNPTVPAGAAGTFTVVYKVSGTATPGTVITDTATVNATNQGFGANSATVTDIVASATQADLALSTVATPAQVLAGNNITYTQAIKNNGPAAATAVSFTQATPTNTTFESVLAPAGWTCAAPAVGATGTINCTNATLGVGTEADIIVVLNVPSGTAAGTITANSSVSSSTSDPNPANNSTTVSTTVLDNCDLAVTNSGSPSPVAAGSNITYTQVITNSGPSNCGSATFSEATPANTTFVSVSVTNTGGGTWTCPNSSPIACTNPSVAPGSTGTVTVVYQVNAGTTAGTIISDTASVATPTTDTNKANNSATVNIAVASGTQADLSVSNAASPNPVSAGGNIAYTQTVTNGGPSAATTPVITETLPANTSFVSLTGPANWTCTNTAPYKCTDTGNLGANASAIFTFVVSVNSTVTGGSTITQTDSVSSSTTDPNSGNNSASATVYVGNSADLSVTNTPGTVPVQAGNTLTYTQVVKNAGPSTATSVSLVETLPANTTGTSLTGPGGWSCNLGTLSCSNPNLAPNAPATITFTVIVNAGTAAGTAINQTVNITSAVPDPNPANNSATAADVVATGTQADLILTNTASPTLAGAGGNVTYTQKVQNLGPAQATGVTLSETTPPNTTFQSIGGAGWTCTTVPAVGGTGAINCTYGNLNVNATASLTLVLQVNALTPSGTSITDTATASASNIVPNLTTNTASATVIVASANSADLAIVKTATPNPVTQGTPLTYTLAVTNNGPASATNVTVTDTLPSVLTYLSSTTTQGSCSEAGATVTCLLGTMANAGTATIDILTIPNQSGVVSNTATVTADQNDPNPADNSSTQTETITAPTSITLHSFSAYLGLDRNGANRVIVTWKTGGEAQNLGFNLYREQNGNRVRVNSSLIAGSALLMRGALPRHAGRSYAWIDPSATMPGGSYWLEDVDVNGTRALHGPVRIQSGARPSNDSALPQSRTFSQLSQAQPPAAVQEQSHLIEAVAHSAATDDRIRKQFELAAHPGVKISIQHEGWYRVAQPDLVKAGLDPNVNPAMLHLYAEAVEQPIEITGATGGPGGFGPQAAINFYGTGIDTPFSDTRVYWLVTGGDSGERIPILPGSAGSNQAPVSYAATVELKQHTTYFPALLTNNGENFFGTLVSSASVDQILSISQLDPNSTNGGHLEITLQGIIVGFPHDVKVTLNGTPLGDVIFTGQAKGHLSVEIPFGLLQEGNNTVTLTSQNGDYDSSLVQFIRITYPHTYVADSDQLKFTGRAGDELTVSGFTSVPAVVDITDPDHPVQLTPRVTANNGFYAIDVQVPWTTTSAAHRGQHTLLAVGEDRIGWAANVQPNHPSHWNCPHHSAEIAMITYDDFAGALRPLLREHEAEGKPSAVISVTDLYDEFSFGERSPFAIRRFLHSAAKNWEKAPHYLLLNGRASLDPRNYLAMGDLDLVPTAIVPAGTMMTASDDWFSDFTNTGMPTIATGRLPVGTLDEAKAVVTKIAGYEHERARGAWISQALLVADRDDTESFTADSKAVQAELPSAMQATDVFVGTVGVATARQTIIDSINSGEVLVNYLGHGAEEQWSGSDIFDINSVNSLTNGSQLPVFLIMDCLNGFFQDAYGQPLGSTLLLAPGGGAVAVLASSGLNQPGPQTQLDKFVVQNAFHGEKTSVGEAIVKAKSKISDVDVRRTFVLLGDPAMQVMRPGNQSH